MPRQTLIAVRPLLEQLVTTWAGTGAGEIRCSWSPLLETIPVGGPPRQPLYCNAVVVFNALQRPASETAALELLTKLHQLERCFGRDRVQELPKACYCLVPNALHILPVLSMIYSEEDF